MTVRRTFWVIFLIMAGCVAGLFFLPLELIGQGNFEDILFRMIYLCMLIILISWLMAWYSVRQFSVRRFARGVRQQLGQVFEERFEVINHSRLPRPWLTVMDESPLPGSGGSRVLSQIGSRELRNYSAYTLLTERGQFSLGPTILSSGDPFGLFYTQKAIMSDRTLLVLPRIVELNTFPFPPGLLPGGKAKRQKTIDITPHAAGVREYVSGDSLNRIHWPTTARRDRMMVKEFEQDPQTDVWIFVDAQHAYHFGKPGLKAPPKIDQFWLWRHKTDVGLPEDTFEYIVCIAASVANYFIRKGQVLGFASSGQQFVMHPPERGERQLGKILETLALIKPSGNMPLLGLVESNFAHILRGSIVILVTSSNDDYVLGAVDALQHRGMRPVVILVDPVSFGSLVSVNDLYANIRSRGVPVTLVSNQADLKETLEHGFTQY